MLNFSSNAAPDASSTLRWQAERCSVAGTSWPAHQWPHTALGRCHRSLEATYHRAHADKALEGTCTSPPACQRHAERPRGKRGCLRPRLQLALSTPAPAHLPGVSRRSARPAARAPAPAQQCGQDTATHTVAMHGVIATPQWLGRPRCRDQAHPGAHEAQVQPPQGMQALPEGGTERLGDSLGVAPLTAACHACSPGAAWPQAGAPGLCAWFL